MGDWFIGLLVGILVGLMYAVVSGESHDTIIEKGYGIYCPDNGKFAFTGECQ
jgi:hypothetical protein